jgi:molybdopterin converting factor small subunit
MMTTIRIPTPLRSFTSGADEVHVEAETVGEALAALGRAHEGIAERVLGADGALRPFVNVYLGPQDIKTLEGLDTKLVANSVLSIIPAVAGGVVRGVMEERA